MQLQTTHCPPGRPSFSLLKSSGEALGTIDLANMHITRQVSAELYRLACISVPIRSSRWNLGEMRRRILLAICLYAVPIPDQPSGSEPVPRSERQVTFRVRPAHPSICKDPVKSGPLSSIGSCRPVLRYETCPAVLCLLSLPQLQRTRVTTHVDSKVDLYESP